ncbi:inner membrane-spanning protein YciB [Alterisphingorhabdus coralli]|uniref:Inner membrane-spanning protein YciB n=1 Tax=Alterisphingorhabdus coralli TaxID=3071408 RepID=A0AA97FAF2_9SPHN|nr:inner membrane-spanning protein YciB [Parasphingorhabdus sp. SCSIO 66989]WOE76536.1 inner membrane-spanning protein YciB [Parasphingorhabdus sp. SCSIO 66989]
MDSQHKADAPDTETVEQAEGTVELDAAKAATAKKAPGWLSLAIDFGPLLIFFLTYRYFAPADDAPNTVTGTIAAITYSTGAFMAAVLVALGISQWKTGKISPMLWLSTILILGFGALTIYFQDETFIQVKPTIIYASLAAILFIGLWRGKALLKYLLHAAFEGLSDEGWRKLSRNWALFFTFLAVLNEVMRASLNFETWLTLKVWGVTALSFVFTFTQLPMLMRHGLSVEDGEAESES